LRPLPRKRKNNQIILPVIPTRNDIVAENDEGLTMILENALTNHQNVLVPFMPVDIEESNEYINQTLHYVLRLYGPLMVVTITGIKVFFEIKNILANEKDEDRTVDVSKIRIGHIKAFPIRGYHTEKKTYMYLRVLRQILFREKSP